MRVDPFFHKICINGGQLADRNAVKHHSPGSRSAPWVTYSRSTIQPQRGWTISNRRECSTPLGLLQQNGRFTQGARHSPRPWAVLLNAVGVENDIERRWGRPMWRETIGVRQNKSVGGKQVRIYSKFLEQKAPRNFSRKFMKLLFVAQPRQSLGARRSRSARTFRLSTRGKRLLQIRAKFLS